MKQYPKGSILVLVAGEYNSLAALLVAAQDLDLQSLKQDYVSETKEQLGDKYHHYFSVSVQGFSEWLTKKGYATPLVHGEINMEL